LVLNTSRRKRADARREWAALGSGLSPSRFEIHTTKKVHTLLHRITFRIRFMTCAT
jgi:hypothetical protein